MILLVPLAAGPPMWDAFLSLSDVGLLLRVDVAAHRLTQFAESGFVVSNLNDLAFIPFVVLTTGISLGAMCTAWLAVRRSIAISK
jgi:hypothetical protein